MTVQLGGLIGPFLDNVQQRQVPVAVQGTCEYQSNGSVVASSAARVDVVGTKVTGKSTSSGAAKITGAP
jgi:hypothetical protein